MTGLEDRSDQWLRRTVERLTAQRSELSATLRQIDWLLTALVRELERRAR